MDKQKRKQAIDKCIQLWLAIAKEEGLSPKEFITKVPDIENYQRLGIKFENPENARKFQQEVLEELTRRLKLEDAAPLN